jgi:HAD superfamily hydrolase (TIGR01509 family)
VVTVPAITAVVFDMDGVLVDTEELWDDVRAELAAETGARYDAAAQRAMMGMSSPEWSALMEELGVPGPPAAINDEVVRRLLARYRERLPLIDGATDAVRRIAAAGFTLAVASSSNRVLIDTVLAGSGLAPLLAATVSSEEVARGKPSPDVYLEACRRIGVAPGAATAVEDSHSGIRAAHAAGLRVVAIPNAAYPPGAEALALADLVLPDIASLTPAAVRGSAA